MPAAKKRKTAKKKVSGLVKKTSGVAAARKRVSSAKKAFKAGLKGSGPRLDKAITAYAKASCGLKSRAK